MDLSLIILNYKSAGLVRQCLKGIMRARLRLDYEVIVVDNNSQDGCPAWVAAHYPQVKIVVLPTNNGYSAGNNAGLRIASGRYVLILNPDVTVLPGRLEALVNFMDNHPAVGLAGPRLTNPDGSLQYSSYRFPNFWLPLLRRTSLRYLSFFQGPLRHYQMLDWDHSTNQPVDWLLGACLIARLQAVAQVGWLDERYFLYVEDTDWCRRFWNNGYQVYYVAEVELVHFHERLSAQASIGAIFKRITWIHIASWFKYFFKWGWRVPKPIKVK